MSSLTAALSEISKREPGTTGADCGRPGGDCPHCEDRIAIAGDALITSNNGDV
jgi:hypothetical protein